jgi:hypothetical protein
LSTQVWIYSHIANPFAQLVPMASGSILTTVSSFDKGVIFFIGNFADYLSKMQKYSSPAAENLA